jgi:hypothetical protein
VIETFVQGSHRFGFDAGRGNMITITARALDRDVDVQVGLYDEDFVLLALNDDHGTFDAELGFFDARITRYIVQQGGGFIVDVTTADDLGGRVEITVERVMTGTPIGRGEVSVTLGSIEQNGLYTQPLEAQAGDLLTITVRSLTYTLDPQVVLVSPDGVIVADNDDHGGREVDVAFYDSRIYNYPVPEDGTYTIEVVGYGGSFGQFAVTVETRR